MRVLAAPPGVESGHVTLPPENWARLKEVFADARALPANLRPAYLAVACGGNEALRREVESLLASDTHAKSFLETPAVLLADTGAKRLEGQRVGPYQITSWIGAGGMGEVYRARDTRLGRDVAIKILPRIFAGDPDRLARFDREARMLASLNHPHIGAIYGVEQSEGVPRIDPRTGRRADVGGSTGAGSDPARRKRSRSPGRSPMRWRRRTREGSSIGT